MYEFWLIFHWSLFPSVLLTIFQHWFRQWLGAKQATSHYLNQWWSFYWRIYASLSLNELAIVYMWWKYHWEKIICYILIPGCHFIANFVHDTTAQLSCLVLNFLAIILSMIWIRTKLFFPSNFHCDRNVWYSKIGYFPPIILSFHITTSSAESCREPQLPISLIIFPLNVIFFWKLPSP